MPDDGDTERTDYPGLFCHELRVELWEIARRLGEIEERLPLASIAERRSILFRLSERLEILGTVATDAAGVVREHVAALTLYLANQHR